MVLTHSYYHIKENLPKDGFPNPLHCFGENPAIFSVSMCVWCTPSNSSNIPLLEKHCLYVVFLLDMSVLFTCRLLCLFSRPPNRKFEDKVFIPQEHHPETNFVGLLIGPRCVRDYNVTICVYKSDSCVCMCF